MKDEVLKNFNGSRFLAPSHKIQGGGGLSVVHERHPSIEGLGSGLATIARIQGKFHLFSFGIVLNVFLSVSSQRWRREKWLELSF